MFTRFYCFRLREIHIIFTRKRHERARREKVEINNILTYISENGPLLARERRADGFPATSLIYLYTSFSDDDISYWNFRKRAFRKFHFAARVK